MNVIAAEFVCNSCSRVLLESECDRIRLCKLAASGCQERGEPNAIEAFLAWTRHAGIQSHHDADAMIDKALGDITDRPRRCSHEANDRFL
jgi:hypothetical protein